jgi:hypothetical protein
VIKAAGTLRGRPMILLGLSGENIARLCADEPIVFDAAELGFDGNVVIVYGRTVGDIVTMIRAHFGGNGGGDRS